MSATEIEAVTVIGDVEGKNVILVDDLTETAGTLVGAARILAGSGGARYLRWRFTLGLDRFGG